MTTRRDFLKRSMAVVSLGLSVPAVFARAAVAARAESSAGAGRTLVVVQLAGGIDGLNTVVPYADGRYRDLRPELAIAETDVLPLDDRLAFNPALASLKGLYDEGKVAVVEGVGYPNPTFSHFKAMDIWQSADPQGNAREGWLGSYFDHLSDAGGHPLAGLSVGRALPSAFESTKTTVPSVESLETFALQAPTAVADKRQGSLVQLYDSYRPETTPFAALLDDTLDSALSSARDLGAAHEAYKPSVTYPESSLASGLQLLAELIDSGEQTPLRVGHVMLSGFDTHTQQDARLAPLLQQTSEALTAFWRDIEAHGHGDDVVVMTWSEFGRRVPENAQNGTDHGSAGPMFLLGNKVKGGIHGEPPSLTDLDDANLRFTVDFRSVYASVLESWLEASAKDVLGQAFEPLDLFAV
jgi:uncharacterized protein (DUF1501 family)